MATRKSKVLSLSVAQGVLIVVHLISGMVFARVLSVADYGTYLQTFLAYDFAIPLLTFGLPLALYYFLPGEKNRQKGLVVDNMLLLFIAGIVFSLFLFLGGTDILAKRFNNPNLEKTLRLLIFYPLYTFPVLLSGSVWVVKDKVKINAIYNLLKGIILTVSLIVAVIIKQSYEAPTFVRVLLPILFFPVTLFLIFKYVPGKWSMPSILSMWNILKFSLPLGLASVLGTVTRQLANLVVSLLTTPEDYAIYAIGAREIPVIGIITGSISVVVMADMAHKIKQEDFQTALELFRKSATLSAGFLLPIMIFLMIYAESFINILYSSKYEQSVLPFRIYLFLLPIRIVYYSSAFIALGKTKAILFRSFFELLLTALFAYLMTMWLGYIGAAIATVSVYYLWAVPFNLIFLGREFNCRSTYILPFKKLGIIIVLSLIAGTFSSIIQILHVNLIITFLLGLLIFGVIYIVSAYKYLPEFKEIIIPLKSRFL